MRIVYLIIFSAALTGCSFASYTRTEGVNKVQVVGIEIGTDRALEGLEYSSDKVSIIINHTDTNQTKGIKSASEGITSAIVKFMGLPG